jgi:hypothetical protein
MSTPGVAVPGSVVTIGSQASPAGPQGLQGTQGTPGLPGPTVVSTDANNQAVLGSDSKIYVPDPTPVITAVRLRTVNCVGNCNFEVDQKLCGTAGPISPSTSGLGPDRWPWYSTGTLRSTVQQIAANVVVPGTSFLITTKLKRITVTTAQASLGATDNLACYATVEGSNTRELYNDVHSISILCRSSVANLKFGLYLITGSGTPYALGKLCSLGAANTFTLITLPNLPSMAGSVEPLG